jgi:tetratricopeptide (TPR) repeat protein
MTGMRRVVIALAAGLSAVAAAWGQMAASCHVMEMKDQIPPGELPAAVRMEGIGNSRLKITANAEAQVWFDQGLNLLHDFWDYESARAFEQGVRVDPQCAMCYWGLFEAESFFHSLAQGYAEAALKEAVRLKGKVSEQERLYIEATAAARGIGGKPADADKKWRQLVREYPDDAQAKLFLAIRVPQEEKLRLLDAVLREDPRNSAANHYYIHALEGTEHPERAERSAEILGSLAPGSGHMVHMPGHIFFRMGDYARAEKAFAESSEVDESYMREMHVAAENDWNYVHNLMYGIANLMEEGKLAQATALSGKLSGARGKFESTLYLGAPRDAMTRVSARLPVALRTGDWALALELLKEPMKGDGHPNLRALAREVAEFAEAMQAVEGHQVVRAEEAAARFEEGLKAMKRPSGKAPLQGAARGGTKLEVNPDALLQPLISVLSVMSQELKGALLAAQGNVAEAKQVFAQAEKDEKDLGYREPPHYIRPVAETEGAALLAAGDWEGAKAAYRRALAERPNSGFALYGIAQASEKAGDARAEYGAFLKAWQGADAGLPQVRTARAYIARGR